MVAIDTRKKRERYYDDQYGRQLTRTGIWNRKVVSEQGGWPDRVVEGGIWIEFKNISYIGKRLIHPRKWLEPAQERFLDSLADHSNDRPLMGIIWDIPDRPRLIQTIDYRVLRHMNGLSLRTILPYADPVSDMREHVKSIFTKADGIIITDDAKIAMTEEMS